MGRKGNRSVTETTAYTEPTLMTNVEQLLRQAADKSCYDGDKLNIEKVVKMVGQAANETVSVNYIPMDSSISGVLEYDNGIWLIKVNNKHNSKRQRFTIAHELGHFMLHRNKSALFEDKVFFRAVEKDNMEYAANSFAALLLMPESRVRKAVNDGMRNIGALADRFGVSSPAMKARVVELGYKLKQND